jgi:hypothetical protein
MLVLLFSFSFSFINSSIIEVLRLFEPGRDMAKTESNRFVFSIDAIIANWNGGRVIKRLLFGLILDTPIFFVWISIYVLWHYIQFANKEEIKKIKLETLIKELELKTIKSQINPHFIFNALGVGQHTHPSHACQDECQKNEKENVKEIGLARHGFSRWRRIDRLGRLGH